MLTRIFIRASLVFLALTGLSATLPAAAHYIWIEQDDVHQARLFFGEYQNKEIERSPGRLDEIKIAPGMADRCQRQPAATRGDTAGGSLRSGRCSPQRCTGNCRGI